MTIRLSNTSLFASLALALPLSFVTLAASCGGDDPSASSTGESESTASNDSGDEASTTGCDDAGGAGCECQSDDDCDTGLECDEGVCADPGSGTGGEPICGDGILQPENGEECDLGASNSDEGLCTSDCQEQECGDGHVGPGEACDDGNQVDDDDCTNECASPSCGDGIVQSPEECDDGNDADDDECLSTCLAATCGDGIVQTGVEECDDANDDNMDGCLADCTTMFSSTCGNGTIDPGEFCHETIWTAVTVVPFADVAVGDFDGDGDDDIAGVSGGTMVEITSGGSAGLAGVTTLGSVDGEGVNIVAFDMDDDGKFEVISAQNSPTDGVGGYAIATGTAGGLSAPVLTTTPHREELAVAVVPDGSGAGVSQVVMGHEFYADVASAPDTCALTFSNGNNRPSGGETVQDYLPNRLNLGDVNGDGDDELLVLHIGGERFHAYIGPSNSPNAGNNFTPRTWTDTGTQSFPNEIAAGDINGDGAEDVLIARWNFVGCPLDSNPDDCTPDRVGIFPGTPTDNWDEFDWGPAVSVLVGNAPTDVDAADFNQDGLDDIVVVNSVSADLSIVQGQSEFVGNVVRTIELNGGQGMTRLAIGDVNDDGVPDIVTAHMPTNLVQVLISNP